MLERCKFHHIGIAVANIEKASSWYDMPGSKRSDVVSDPVQKVRICWLRRHGAPLIELIEPSCDNSPVSSALKRSGPGPYHACYSVPDLEKAVSRLRSEGALQLGRPVAAPAISGSLVCFMYSRDAGLIELVEEPAVPAGFES